MHEGPLADRLAADIQAAGGLVTAADLSAARPQVLPPLPHCCHLIVEQSRSCSNVH